MQVTVKEISKLKILQDTNVKTARDQLDQCQVEWVSVIETPVENFVRKNEFVLSTGIGCGQDEELFLKFIQEIIEAKAAALVIAKGRYIKEIPQNILTYAEEHQFPIIEIPWEVRFADIIHSILQTLNRHEDKVVEDSETMRKKLLQLILQGAGLTDIATTVYDKIKLPVIITDKRGIVKGKSPNASPLEQRWNHYISNELETISQTSIEQSNYLSHPHIQWLDVGEEQQSILQLTIQSASEVQGYLLIETDEKYQDNEGALQPFIYILEHAATTVALCFLHENAVRETELRLRDDFVWSLAKGKITSWETALSRAKSLGYQINIPYICIIGYPENLEDIHQKSQASATSSHEHWLQGMIRCFEEEVFHTGRTVNLQTMSTFQREELVIFLEVTPGKSNESSFTFLELLNTRLHRLFPDLILSWGIGKQYGFKHFHESFNEAQMALNIGRRQKGPGHQSTYADTRVDRALMSLLGNEELQQITDSTIGSLVEYSKDRGIDLIHTFVSYNQNRGNVSQTARKLNLHRQSLLYRLRKIESLTGCSLDNPDDVFLVDLSIKLWTLGINEPKQAP
ncbi:PucR family transcriptional regulator [Desertibacillus haloalkaliphilus]|uniref:PucR family transcriptional regulator n=1 Tax=Desertibacillus haloalkaliphilus TaxID=1328930 RepID=UPI001C25B831|nr:PucR family transcriptional regulator [Desertibacillus haloalkaliphilus]MBU8907340.1 PucR family transcriptional regulator ligand-binding domain-containing protein [Desertibacillus haloalkaliphilus]